MDEGEQEPAFVPAPHPEADAEKDKDGTATDSNGIWGVLGSRDLFLKIAGMTRSAAIVARLQCVCRAWQEIAGSSDELWNHITVATFPRAGQPFVQGMNWGSTTSWKQRFRMLSEMKPVLVWVDDRPEGCESLMDSIRREGNYNLHHFFSTKQAKEWLTSNYEALCPTLKVITDNHRYEADEAGEMQSNYDAGKQLVTWLNSHNGSTFDDGAFSDCQILMFCGRGSLPFVDVLKTEHSNLKITISGETLISWVEKPFDAVAAYRAPVFHDPILYPQAPE